MEEIKENEIRFTMRMDSDLYETLKESAKQNKRSIAKELEYITEMHFKEPNKIFWLPNDLNQKFSEFIKKCVEEMQEGR